ncbi:Phosphocarrier protein kinase/phosphorylase, nitrogen regulation associated [Labilithrix luteola]|uniref:Phosphocarrier protein kinase/phosphorylase, nitrogen regulation associated n=1 Tax=Labilithrix luteola TaxID=1391654 RepID=A0A0K1PUK5_9BACT|nr:GAF domain-containing protein [Labilithrix luteola]AKU97208.1 Phosphocarrier protein kinase/phosphorylase, nitrogen regulation associated [Labilithrix luteola]
MPAATKPKVHGRGNKRLDAVLDFVAFAAKPMPLVTLLDEAPRRIASIFDVPVCSLYLVEGDGHQLVMRGNIGFAHTAIGQVRLQIGEGMTGEAVEYLRPVSSENAAAHHSYKHFEDLGEEQVPVFLAVPIRGKSGPLGALVIQRPGWDAFDARDIELLAALGAIIAAGIRHAELIDARRERPAAARRAGGGTRKVTLTGRPFVPGRALGAIAALRRPAGHRTELREEHDTREERRLVRGAFDVAEKAIRALFDRARVLKLGNDAAFLSTYGEILEDMRFRERADELVAEGIGIAGALNRVAREVTRTAASITRDPFLEERARDIEDLCDAISMLAAADKRAELPSKAVLVGDALSVFDLLISARAQPVGVALTDRASGPRTRALLRLLDVPAIVGVEGLFRWASDGDVTVLDADHGLLVINPSKSEVAALREYKRAHGDLAQNDEDR